MTLYSNNMWLIAIKVIMHTITEKLPIYHIQDLVLQEGDEIDHTYHQLQHYVKFRWPSY